MNARPIGIVGGGLAGLSLGLALRHAGVDVRILEAGDYPRHRVCGEFITGLAPSTIDRLHLRPLLADAHRHRGVAWFQGARLLRRETLPAAALALSRHALDARLAAAFTELGGELLTGQRVDLRERPAGRVFACGRQRARSSWVGLKVHARGLALAANLELHLGREAYVGLCPVEDGWVNVCGLFRVQTGLPADRTAVLPQYLRRCGLGALADRLAAAEIDPASHCAVAGLSFARTLPAPDRLALGDALTMIPPFTGNGMAIALQSAELSLDPLLAWTRGERDWPATVTVANARLQRAFRRRLRSAAVLHPFLLSPFPQRLLATASRCGVLPTRPLYAALH
ncbi:FAD-dependent monooxygenase [Horticoccus luteus]|uniref:FAD-dependent monooxygenase n=1 Tax=Horticoccus luteus TaxID=2862869 RepID=A0A8F9TWE7_9BACT|nr:FAD-dependent monooxygenase [Horticoccus luteus]QYM79039.1 FAD-dependent monooxygenase [Horticoccus luteus]